MQICLMKSAFSAATDHLSTGIFFLKKNRQSIRDKYMRQRFRVQSLRNAFNGILLYDICLTLLIFISMLFNNISSYVFRC